MRFLIFRDAFSEKNLVIALKLFFVSGAPLCSHVMSPRECVAPSRPQDESPSIMSTQLISRANISRTATMQTIFNKLRFVK